MTRRLLACASAAAVLVAGCGTAKLTDAEKGDVARAQQALAERALGVIEGGGGSGEESAAAERAVDQLIALYRSKPDAELDGKTMRQVLQDEASRIDEYDRDLADKLARAIR